MSSGSSLQLQEIALLFAGVSPPRRTTPACWLPETFVLRALRLGLFGTLRVSSGVVVPVALHDCTHMAGAWSGEQRGAGVPGAGSASPGGRGVLRAAYPTLGRRHRRGSNPEQCHPCCVLVAPGLQCSGPGLHSNNAAMALQRRRCRGRAQPAASRFRKASVLHSQKFLSSLGVKKI